MSEALKAAQRIVDVLSSPASLMGGELAIFDMKDVGLVARALLTQAERGRQDAEHDAVVEKCAKVADEIAQHLALESNGAKAAGHEANMYRINTALHHAWEIAKKVRALKRSGQESGERKDGEFASPRRRVT